jgi:hypothetical protein
MAADAGGAGELELLELLLWWWRRRYSVRLDPLLGGATGAALSNIYIMISLYKPLLVGN